MEVHEEDSGVSHFLTEPHFAGKPQKGHCAVHNLQL